MRLRDVATATGMTQRGAYAVVTDFVNGGYVVKERDGHATDIACRLTIACITTPSAPKPSVSCSTSSSD
jgi:hypothetical protein